MWQPLSAAGVGFVVGFLAGRFRHHRRLRVTITVDSADDIDRAAE